MTGARIDTATLRLCQWWITLSYWVLPPPAREIRITEAVAELSAILTDPDLSHRRRIADALNFSRGTLTAAVRMRPSETQSSRATTTQPRTTKSSPPVGIRAVAVVATVGAVATAATAVVGATAATAVATAGGDGATAGAVATVATVAVVATAVVAAAKVDRRRRRGLLREKS